MSNKIVCLELHNHRMNRARKEISFFLEQNHHQDNDFQLFYLDSRGETERNLSEISSCLSLLHNDDETKKSQTCFPADDNRIFVYRNCGKRTIEYIFHREVC